eukprot:jgi/Ulvmu1/9701/UM055_0039.1
MSLLSRVHRYAARVFMASVDESAARFRQWSDVHGSGWVRGQLLAPPFSRGQHAGSGLPEAERPVEDLPAHLAHQSGQPGSEAVADNAVQHGDSPELDTFSEESHGSALPEVEFDAADANYVRVMGRIGHDPTVKETAKGKSVANLHMYVYQGKYSDAARVSVQAWGDLAHAVQKGLRKGMQIRVDGFLKENVWISKDATKASKLVINALQVARVRSRGETKPSRSAASRSAAGLSGQ